MVLPFTNLSGDPSQDYFADGITENLTTDLSRIRNSFVIARNTAFTFKGKNIADISFRVLSAMITVFGSAIPCSRSARFGALPDNRLLLGRTEADQIANYDQSGGDPDRVCSAVCACRRRIRTDIMPWRALAGLKCPPAESKLCGSRLPTAWM